MFKKLPGFITITCLSAFIILPASAQVVYDSLMWVPNGPVNSLVKSGNNIYLGGSFSYMGTPTGTGMPLDTNTGLPRIPGFPKVDGPIYAVAPDSWGGWYIGGNFSTVGGQPRKNFARITVKGIVCPVNPSPDGPVYAITIIPTSPTSHLPRPNVYVGGNFTTIGGKQRNSIAVINPYDGSVYDGWMPKISGTVYSITRIGNYSVIIGGAFSSVDNQPISNLCLVSAFTGGNINNLPPHVLNNTFNLSLNGPVRATYYYTDSLGSFLLIGGDFTFSGNTNRNHLARINMFTYQLTGWNPNANNTVYCFAKRGNFNSTAGDFGGGPPPGGRTSGTSPASYSSPYTVLIGGTFTVIAGQSRNGVAQLWSDTALVTSWNCNSDGPVYSMNYDPRQNLYIGGAFKNIGGQPRRYGAKLDSNGVAIAAFQANFSDPVRSISLNDSIAYYAGDFVCMNGVLRSNLAAVNPSTGQPSSWNPSINGPVNSLALSANNILYLGGNFTSVNSTARNRLAAFDLNTISLTSFNPNCDGIIRTMMLDSNKLYTGGYFTTIGTQSRSNAACINVNTGIANAWSPVANGTVNSLVLSGSRVFCGGYFSVIGGAPRSGLAALDTVGGFAVSAWHPSPNDGVYAIAVAGNNLAAGGWFTSVDGQPRNNFCTADAGSGSLGAMNAGPDGFVRAIGVSGNYAFVGGDFSTFAGLPRKSFASYEVNSGAVQPLNISLGASPLCFLKDGNSLYIGGNFLAMQNDVHAYFVKADTWYLLGNNDQPPQSSDFSIYPNPTQGEFSISGSLAEGTKQLTISVFNAIGQKIFAQTEQAAGDYFYKNFDFSFLKPGIYFIRLENGKNLFSSRLLKID